MNTRYNTTPARARRFAPLTLVRVRERTIERAREAMPQQINIIINNKQQFLLQLLLIITIDLKQ